MSEEIRTLSTLHDVAVEIKALPYDDMKELAEVIFHQVQSTLQNNGDRDDAALGELSWGYFADTINDWAEDTITEI